MSPPLSTAALTRFVPQQINERKRPRFETVSGNRFQINGPTSEPYLS